MNVCLWKECLQNSGIQRSSRVVVSFIQRYHYEEKKNLTPWKVPAKVNVKKKCCFCIHFTIVACDRRLEKGVFVFGQYSPNGRSMAHIPIYCS